MESVRLLGLVLFLLQTLSFVFSHGYSDYIAELTKRNQILTQEFFNSHPRGQYVMDFMNSDDYTSGHPVLDETLYGHHIDNSQWKEFIGELAAARRMAAGESEINDTEPDWPNPKWRNSVELPTSRLESSDGGAPSRRTEVAQQNMLWGQHRVSGGSGEIGQWLDYALIGAGLQDEDENVKPESKYMPGLSEFKENILPAYCDPPNPCPIGYDPKQLDSPCNSDFVYTAQANRDWIMNKISSGECTCDLEHMNSCAAIDGGNAEDHLPREHTLTHNPYIQGQKRKWIIAKKSEYYKKHPHRYYHSGKVLKKVTKKAGTF